MTAINRNTDWFSVFRILFGCLAVLTPVRFFYKGWITELYVVPRFHFTFSGFGWIKVLPPAAMYTLFLLMVICGIAIALNRFYRLACIAFLLIFSYTELIDVTYYLNHYYLISLLSFIMIFYDSRSPASTIHNQRVLFFLKLQVSIVYFFGGINKLEADWMFSAQPLKIWLHAGSGLPLIGSLLARETTAHVVAWAAIIFDVGIAFTLWCHKTRLASYVLLSVFHVATALLFNIGIFPWIMMSAALLFFNDALSVKKIFSGCRRQLTLVPLGAVALWQLLFPLRHLIYPGNYLWTERGFRFAWNIMLIEKNGTIDYGATDRAGKTYDIDEERFLTPFQLKMLATQPDLILQFARHLKQQQPNISSVFAECYVSLNGRRSKLLFDPTLNLLTQPNELYKNIRLHTVAP